MAGSYLATRRIKHSLTNKFYERGEEVPVDHLDPGSLEVLLEAGILREVMSYKLQVVEASPEPVAYPAAEDIRNDDSEDEVKNND